MKGRVQLTLTILLSSLLTGVAPDETEPWILPSSMDVDPKDITQPPFEKDTEPLSLSDMHSAGHFLLPVSLIFIFINGFLVVLLCYNWEHISDSVYYNSTLLCMLLTCSDLALSLFVGFPIGVRLAFEEHLRKSAFLKYYTKDVCFLLWEYLYVLRVIAVAVISVERCVHIFKPFRYMFIATKLKVKVACCVIIILPFLRIAPTIYVLHVSKDAVAHCTYYNDPTTSHQYYAPLTCMLDMRANTLPGFGLVDIVVMAVLIGIAWVLILISNVLIVVVIFDKVFNGFLTRKQKLEVNKKLMKISVVVLAIASSFALTNFPFAYAWGVHALDNDENYRQHFYLILLSFLSLFFHPWFYCLRMKNVRDLVTGVKKRFKSLRSPSMGRSFATSSMMLNFSRSSNGMIHKAATHV